MKNLNFEALQELRLSKRKGFLPMHFPLQVPAELFKEAKLYGISEAFEYNQEKGERDRSKIIGYNYELKCPYFSGENITFFVAGARQIVDFKNGDLVELEDIEITFGFRDNKDTFSQYFKFEARKIKEMDCDLAITILEKEIKEKSEELENKKREKKLNNKN